MKRNKEFYSSIRIFLSVMSFVVMTFIINSAYDSLLFESLGVIGLIILTGLKVFFYAGVYGQIIELISGEEIAINFRDVLKNGKQFWFVYFVFTSVPFVLYKMGTLWLSFSREISLGIFYAHFHIIVLYLIAERIIFEKYLKGQRPLKDKQRIEWNLLPMIGLLYGADLFLFYLPLFLSGDGGNFQNAIVFLQECVQYLQWIFISFLILRQYPHILKQFQVTNGKELYLISPIGGGVFDSLGSLVYKRNPAAFVVLKGLTPHDYKIRTFNQYLWRDRYYKPDVLVAITCYTVNSEKAYKIAKEFKKAGAKVIMGGPHVGCVPEEALEFCDSVVIGEAESIWKQVIDDYENDSLQKKYYGKQKDTFCEEVQQEILNAPFAEMKDYLETTRGCKYRCDFCSVPSLCGGKVRTKAIGQVVEVLKRLKRKYRKFSFLDNNIYSDPAYARELFKAIQPLHIKWGAGCSIDIVKNPEDLQLAKDSGCEGLLFGYEIIDNSEEKLKGGKYSFVDKYIEYSQEVKRKGIEIKGSFIVGWEKDTWLSLLQLLIFAFRIHPQTAIVNILTPLPKSNFYNQLLRQKRLTTLNWRNYGFSQLVYKHNHFNRFLLEKVFMFYRPLLFLITSQYGNLYLVIIIYIFLLPFLARNIILILP